MATPLPWSVVYVLRAYWGESTGVVPGDSLGRKPQHNTSTPNSCRAGKPEFRAGATQAFALTHPSRHVFGLSSRAYWYRSGSPPGYLPPRWSSFLRALSS